VDEVLESEDLVVDLSEEDFSLPEEPEPEELELDELSAAADFLYESLR